MVGQSNIFLPYVWRIASALKWGFADFDTGSVAVDRDTLTPEDLEKVTKMIADRPYHFCRFLSALLGVDKMEQLMSEAIAEAIAARLRGLNQSAKQG